MRCSCRWPYRRPSLLSIACAAVAHPRLRRECGTRNYRGSSKPKNQSTSTSTIAVVSSAFAMRHPQLHRLDRFHVAIGWATRRRDRVGHPPRSKLLGEPRTLNGASTTASNPYLFRDTVLERIASPNLEHNQLTASNENAA
jgi:hypothetical protein